MASCPKCGKTKIAKPQGRPRSCKRCGTLLGSNGNLMRHGVAR